MTRLVAAAIAAVLSVTLAGQAPRVPPAFEVTSVKPNDSGGPRGGRVAPGIFEQTNVTLRALVGMAYPGEVAGGPTWVDVEHFDVAGKGDFPMSAFLAGADGTAPPVYMMLRALLADRFKLVTHTGSEERPIYGLVFSRVDKRPGTNLRARTVDCGAVLQAAVHGTAPPDIPAGARRPPCAMRRSPGHISGNSVTMSQLARALSTAADRPVFDRTGLTGTFDLDVEWGELQAGPSGVPAPRNASPGDDTPIFTALSEQLGLKLEATRGPVDVVVIDHAEHPTQN